VATRLWFAERRENAGGLILEFRQAVLEDFLNTDQVDPQIIMHQNVSEPRNLAPFDFRVSRFQIAGDALRRFRQDLEISQDRILRFAITHERIFPFACILLNTGGTLNDVY